MKTCLQECVLLGGKIWTLTQPKQNKRGRKQRAVLGSYKTSASSISKITCSTPSPNQWNAQDTLRIQGGMLHSDGLILPGYPHQASESFSLWNPKPASQSQKTPQGETNSRLLAQWFGNILACRAPWGGLSGRGEGRKGDCEALECPLAQKVDAQLDLEKVTKNWCPIRFRKSSSL